MRSKNKIRNRVLVALFVLLTGAFLSGADSRNHPVIATTKNGIKISDINNLERIKIKQASKHNFWATGNTQFRYYRPVFITLASPSMHNPAPHQIKDRDKL